MGHGDSKTHQCATANMMVHHPQDFRHARTFGFEILDVEVFVVVEASRCYPAQKFSCAP